MSEMTVEEAMSPYSYPHESDSPEGRMMLFRKWTRLVGEVESLRAALAEKERQLLASQKAVKDLREAGDYMDSELKFLSANSDIQTKNFSFPGQKKWHKALSQTSNPTKLLEEHEREIEARTFQTAISANGGLYKNPKSQWECGYNAGKDDFRMNIEIKAEAARKGKDEGNPESGPPTLGSETRIMRGYL